MPGKAVLWFPVLYALLGTIVVLISGDRFQVTTYTFTIGPWGFVVIWVLGHVVLYFIYRWLLAIRKPRYLFWLHFFSTFLGLGGFLYMLLPLNGGGKSLDSMIRYLGWSFAAAFLILVGTMSMIAMLMRELFTWRRRRREKHE